MPIVDGIFVEPGAFSQLSPSPILPVLPGGVQVTTLIGTGRNTNLVTGENVTKGSGATDTLAHSATVIDSTTITDANFALYIGGVDYSQTPVSNGLGWDSASAFLTGTVAQTYNGLATKTFIASIAGNPNLSYTFVTGDFAVPTAATALEVDDALTGGVNDTTASTSFVITKVVDITHLIVSSTTGLTAGDTIVQGANTTTIAVGGVVDAVHLTVTSTTGFHVGSLSAWATDTTGLVSFLISSVVDSTHLLVSSTAGLTAGDTIVQGAASTTITTVTDSTHLVVASTTGFHNGILGSVSSGTFVTLTTPVNFNSSILIQNGTSNTTLGFTAGSLQQTPQRPLAGVTYTLNYEYAKATSDYTPSFFFDMTDIITAYGPVASTKGMIASDATNSFLYSLSIGANLVFQQGASVVCAIQINPADGSLLQQFQSAINKLQAVQGINILVPLYPDSSPASTLSNLFAFVKAHVDLMSSITERQERTAIVGLVGTYTLSQIAAFATGLVDKRVVLAAYSSLTQTGTMFIGTDSNPTTVDGSFLAAALAGIKTSTANDVAESLTRKSPVGFNTLPDTLLRSQKNYLASNGVCVTQVVNSVPTVLFGTTTDTSTINNQEYSVVTIVDFVAVSMRQLLEAIFIGHKILPDTPSQVASTAVAILQDLVNSQIIDSFPLNGVNAKVNPLVPTEIDVQVSYAPVYPDDLILITFSLTT